ncbi:MAG: hypothetical protein ACR2OZ_11440 [Verrucomicrobiales bacterium]
MKPNDYVEMRNNGWYIRGSRVSLDSLIYAFKDGFSQCAPHPTQSMMSDKAN